MSRIRCLAVALVLLASAAEARADESMPPVALEPASPDPRWVVGQVTVAAPPDAVWSRLQNVGDWPKLLTDVARLDVVDRQGSRWEIELETRTLGHGELPYHVDLDAGRRVRFWRSGSGVAVQAFLLVRNGPTKDEANVVYSLYIRLSGLPRLLISDSSLHQKQEHMVTVTLGDLYRAFPPP